MRFATHIADPHAAALDPTPAVAAHLEECGACAQQVRMAERFLARVRRLRRDSPGLDRGSEDVEGFGTRLPDPSMLSARGRARRAVRVQRRRLVLAAATVLLALGIGQQVRVHERHARDRADDALLRSIQAERDVPDLVGLGMLVDSALSEAPAQAGPDGASAARGREVRG